jgi:hypothetical protein
MKLKYEETLSARHMVMAVGACDLSVKSDLPALPRLRSNLGPLNGRVRLNNYVRRSNLLGLSILERLD